MSKIEFQAQQKEQLIQKLQKYMSQELYPYHLKMTDSAGV
jgi:uncharacterized protein (DUF2164 family)